MLIRTLLLVAALFVTRAAVAQDQGVSEWIRSNAVRLTTAEARNGFTDMQGLRRIVGNARIVSLGEATHGTREFFQLKHRMMEFLATEMGFTIFSIEANMPEAYRLNDYVLNGTGDPAALLRGMYFWTWNTEEVLDMIKWMREFNASGKGRVQFTGFDMQTTAVAAGIVRTYVERNEPAYLQTVREAIAMTAQPQTQQYNAFGVMTGTFPVAAVAGKRVKYSGYIRTDSITTGYAGLWWRADGPNQSVLVFDNMNVRGPRATTPWTRYEMEFVIPRETVNINFGAIHPGNGKAWFADLEVEIDGQKYSSDRFDFSLASMPPRGFYAGGSGYDVISDNAEQRNGKPTLRFHQVSRVTETSMALPPRAAAASWRAVYEHLRSTSSSTADGRWAIQNARVVLQAMQSRTGEVTRDQSMADNIKWILDENPNAKIVLWAHNGHVSAEAADRPGTYRPMGASLRDMYGSQMVVFGFAFNQGSFQAIDMGPDRRLRPFTVPPNDSGSLDATLASAGLPMFALDVRNGPASGPVATWLAQPHATRWIGAGFQDGASQRYNANIVTPRTFDAIIFVERTTSARPNTPAR